MELIIPTSPNLGDTTPVTPKSPYWVESKIDRSSWEEFTFSNGETRLVPPDFKHEDYIIDFSSPPASPTDSEYSGSSATDPEGYSDSNASHSSDEVDEAVPSNPPSHFASPQNSPTDPPTPKDTPSSTAGAGSSTTAPRNMVLSIRTTPYLPIVPISTLPPPPSPTTTLKNIVGPLLAVKHNNPNHDAIAEPFCQYLYDTPLTTTTLPLVIPALIDHFAVTQRIATNIAYFHAQGKTTDKHYEDMLAHILVNPRKWRGERGAWVYSDWLFDRIVVKFAEMKRDAAREKGGNSRGDGKGRGRSGSRGRYTSHGDKSRGYGRGSGKSGGDSGNKEGVGSGRGRGRGSSRGRRGGEGDGSQRRGGQ
ncbi:unnamed protein product [Periconia digitata]|uniref:Uncharacterized protein n=1 Tax=Periconia digitata TaxID=1303443 RepID=A0A9W4UB74_9PLEO|nr:unnamed protein product [Periconia digitata]